MAPHPTYVTVRGESGRGIQTVLYAGPSQNRATELAKEHAGVGEKIPGKELLRYRYFTKVQAWSKGEKVAETVHDRNGNVREKEE